MAIELKTSIPGPKSVELMNRRKSSVARGPFHATPLFVERAEGAILEDVDGNRLLDFASGIGVVNVGHTSPALVGAIREQATKILHGSFNVTPYAGYIELAEKLNQLTPGKFPKKTLLVNSGSEAVENAIKAARAFTGRPGIICFEHAFHGRTYMAMTLTGKEKPYKTGFGPMCSDVYRVPYPASGMAQLSLQKFTEMVRNVGVENIAAVIIEPVLGEGGFIPASREFMQDLRQYCTQHNIVMIADEIQTGFGRTGTLFACEQMGVEPDLMTIAKGLGGGMPISAVTGRTEIMDAPIEGGLGGTYGGNPVACAAALQVIEMFETGDILQRARAIGETLQVRLKQWFEKFPHIGEVRGLGPMRAFELVKNRDTNEPWPEAAAAIKKYCYENGVVTLTCGHYGNVVRLLMPLVIEPADLEEGLAVMENAIASVT